MSNKVVLIAGLVLLLTACQSQVPMAGVGTNAPGRLAALDQTKGELIAHFRVAPPPKSSAFKLAVFDTTGIAKIKLQIIGGALTAPMEKALDLRANNQMSERFVLPVGTNYVITAYPYSDDAALIDSEVMYASFNIKPGSQQVNLNWRSSPGGQLLAKLYAMGRKDLAQSLDMVSLQKTVDEMQMKLAALTTVPITDKLTTFKDATDATTETFNRSYKVVDVNQLLTMVVNNNGLPDFTVTPPPAPSLESSKIFVAELKPQVRDPLYGQVNSCELTSAYAIPASRTSTNVFFGEGSGKVSGFMLAGDTTLQKLDFTAVPSVDTLLPALGGDAAMAAPMELVAADVFAAKAMMREAAVKLAPVMDAGIDRMAMPCKEYTNINAGMMISGGGFGNEFNDGDGDYYDDKDSYQVLINGEKAPIIKWSDEGIAFAPHGFNGFGMNPPNPMPAQAIISIVSPKGITTFAYQANHTIKLGENKADVVGADNDGDGTFDPVALNYNIFDPAGNKQDYALNWNMYNVDEKGNETWVGSSRYFGLKDDPAAFALIDSKGQIWPKNPGKFKVTVSGLHKDAGLVSFYGSVAVAGKTLDMVFGEGAVYDKAKSVDGTTLVQMIKDKGWDPANVEYRSYTIDPNGKQYLSGSSVGEKLEVEVPVVFAEKDGTLYAKAPGQYKVEVTEPKSRASFTLSGYVKLQMDQKLQTYAIEVIKNTLATNPATAGRGYKEFDWAVKQADKVVGVLEDFTPDGTGGFGVWTQGASGDFTITATHLKDGSSITFKGTEGVPATVAKELKFYFSEGKGYDPAVSEDKASLPEVLKAKGWGIMDITARAYNVDAVSGKEYKAFSYLKEKNEVSFPVVTFSPEGAIAAKGPGKFAIHLLHNKTGEDVVVKGEVHYRLLDAQPWAQESLINLVESNPTTLGRDIREFEWTVENADPVNPVAEYKEPQLVWTNQAGTYKVTAKSLKDGATLSFNGDAIVTLK